jgi:hypothetical protein
MLATVATRASLTWFGVDVCFLPAILQVLRSNVDKVIDVGVVPVVVVKNDPSQSNVRNMHAKCT